MMERRTLLLTMAAALGATALYGCGGKTSGDSITASFHNMSEPFFVAMRRNAEDEAAKRNINLSVVDGQSNSAKQTADLDVALATGAKGIILAPTDVNALAPAVNKVLSLNIPIVTVDRRIDGTDRPVPHVGADNVAGGRILADYIVQRFPQGARIVELTGGPGSSSAIDRRKGFHEGLAKAGPKYRIVAEQTGNWKRDEGLTVAQNILTALGAAQRPDVIFAHNDDMALGAVEALRTARISGVAVLGFDAMPEALKLVQTGEMAATVEQSPSRQIRTAIDQIVDNIRKGTPIKGANITPILITRDTMKDAERLSEVK